MQHITLADSADPNNKGTINAKGELIVSFPGVTSSVYTEVLVAMGITSTSLFSSNTERRKATIQNFSEAGTNDVVYYGIGVGVTGYGKGVALLDGDSADFETYTGDLRAILGLSAVAGVTMRILEKF